MYPGRSPEIRRHPPPEILEFPLVRSVVDADNPESKSQPRFTTRCWLLAEQRARAAPFYVCLYSLSAARQDDDNDNEDSEVENGCC